MNRHKIKTTTGGQQSTKTHKINCYTSCISTKRTHHSIQSNSVHSALQQQSLIPNQHISPTHPLHIPHHSPSSRHYSTFCSTTPPLSSNSKSYWKNGKGKGKGGKQKNSCPKNFVNLTNAPQLFGGLLPIYKPRGVTSTDLSNYIRSQLTKIHPALRFGFAGTLDENASGVFLGAVGSATQFIRFALPHDKTYVARMKLGEKTDSCDVLGKVVDTAPLPAAASFTKESIQQLVDKKFIGEIEQTPPAFSALKINGQRASDLARQGKTVEMATRKVQIYNIEVLDYDGEYMDIRVHCGKGTYIRSLALDLAHALGTTCHLTQLTRTQVGLAETDEQQRPPLTSNYQELIQRDQIYSGNDTIVNQILDNQRNYGVYLPTNETTFSPQHVLIAEDIATRFNAKSQHQFDPHFKYEAITIEHLMSFSSVQAILDHLIPPHFLVNYSQYHDCWQDDFDPSKVSGQTKNHRIVPSRQEDLVFGSENDENDENDGNDQSNDSNATENEQSTLQTSTNAVKGSKAKPIKGLNPSGHHTTNIHGNPIEYLTFDYKSPIVSVPDISSTPFDSPPQQNDPKYEPSALSLLSKYQKQSTHSHAMYLDYHSPMRYLYDYSHAQQYNKILSTFNEYFYDLHMLWLDANRPNFFGQQATKELRHVLQKTGLSQSAQTNQLKIGTVSNLDPTSFIPIYAPNLTNESKTNTTLAPPTSTSTLNSPLSTPNNESSSIFLDPSHPILFVGNKYALPFNRNELRKPYSFFNSVDITFNNNNVSLPQPNDFSSLRQFKLTSSASSNSFQSSPTSYRYQQSDQKFSQHNPTSSIEQNTSIFTSVPHKILPQIYPMTAAQQAGHAKYYSRTEKLYNERRTLNASHEHLELWDSINRSKANILDTRRKFLQSWDRRVPLLYNDSRIIYLQRYSNHHHVKSSPHINIPTEHQKRWRLWSRLTRDIQGNILNFNSKGELIHNYFGHLHPNIVSKQERFKLKTQEQHQSQATNSTTNNQTDETSPLLRKNTFSKPIQKQPFNPKLNSIFNRESYANEEIANYIDEYRYTSLGPERYQYEQQIKTLTNNANANQKSEISDNHLIFDQMKHKRNKMAFDSSTSTQIPTQYVPPQNITEKTTQSKIVTHVAQACVEQQQSRQMMTFHEKRMYIKRLKIEHSKLLRRLSLETTMLEQLTHSYLTQRQEIYHQREQLMGELSTLQAQYSKLNQKVKQSTDIQTILHENIHLKEQIKNREEQLLLLSDRLSVGNTSNFSLSLPDDIFGNDQLLGSLNPSEFEVSQLKSHLVEPTTDSDSYLSPIPNIHLHLQQPRQHRLAFQLPDSQSDHINTFSPHPSTTQLENQSFQSRDPFSSLATVHTTLQHNKNPSQAFVFDESSDDHITMEPINHSSFNKRNRTQSSTRNQFNF